MASTATATELKELPPLIAPILKPEDAKTQPHEQTRPSTADAGRAPSPIDEAPRVFDAVHPVAAAHAGWSSRLLITMLIVVANTIQVGHYYHPT